MPGRRLRRIMVRAAPWGAPMWGANAAVGKDLDTFGSGG